MIDRELLNETVEIQRDGELVTVRVGDLKTSELPMAIEILEKRKLQNLSACNFLEGHIESHRKIVATLIDYSVRREEPIFADMIVGRYMASMGDSKQASPALVADLVEEEINNRFPEDENTDPLIVGRYPVKRDGKTVYLSMARLTDQEARSVIEGLRDMGQKLENEAAELSSLLPSGFVEGDGQ